MNPSRPAVLSPLVRTVMVPWAPDRAFRRFTDEMAEWWPLATHSVGGARARRCGVDGRVGGQVFEELDDGSRSVWGTITAWEPPTRVAFTWHPGRQPETAQDVEVRFIPVAQGTRLQLTHTGWERLGEDAGKARRGYPLGWTYVLNCWAGRRRSATNVLLDGVIFVLQKVQRLRTGKPA